MFCIQSLLAALLSVQANTPNYHAKSDNLVIKYYSFLDSVVTYNNNGDVIRKIDSYVIKDNRLISCVETIADIVTKYNYDYDNCGNLIQYVVSKFSKEQNTYLLKFKEEWGFQNSPDCTNPLLINHLSEGIPESEAATTYKFEKDSYKYFPNGNIQQLTKENEFGTVIQEISYTYDTEGRVENILSKSIENNQLIPSAKVVYTYFPVSDNINHFKTETIYNYNADTEVICMKTIYDPSKYTSEKLFTSTVEYYDASGVLINKEVRTSKYSGNLERMEKSEIKIFDDKNQLAATIAYDDEGNVINSEISEQRLTWTGKWVYDKELGIDTYSLKSNDTNATLWSMSVYYDPDIQTDHSSFGRIEKPQFEIFPNPVKDNLFIKYSLAEDVVSTPISYSVHSLTGKPLLHGTTYSQEAISVRSLPSGSYIIVFAAGEYKGTSVFVKQ